ncbi:hypothetical protein LPTSP3_g31020 [Leptospira kobayashii]|uniref:Uncharacterized protein n=1 Tax=Leptospira kobayashii TaxID=1917830 RepID=A0ABN6KLJ9_9LEPT|nr:hypothetical protein [Leptospira kobayashii]BDA80172.1 hypothetical protein LPTSP3_g31020 [Leptospira kobayashii]
MEKVKIKLYRIGNLYKEIDFRALEQWNSKIFTFIDDIQTLSIQEDTQGPFWRYLDKQLENIIPKPDNKILSLCIIDHPLEENYYIRRLSDNRVCISIHEIKDILKTEEISLNNYLLRCIYELALVFHSQNSKVPISLYKLAHDENRGCLFDMNAHKENIAKSCNLPILCDECYVKYKAYSVSTEFLDRIRKEIKKINRNLFYIIKAFIQKRPIVSIVLTSLFAIFLNILSSYIFEKIKELFQNIGNVG